MFRLISSKQRAYSFRNQTLSPIRLPNPIANLCLVIVHIGGMKTVGKHNPAGAYRFICLFQDDGIGLGSGKYRPDYFKAVLHRSMRHPSGYGAYIRITRVSIQYSGFRFSPGAQNQSFCFNHTGRFLKLNVGKFTVNPDGGFVGREFEQDVIGVCRSAREMVYVPVLPFGLADLKVILIRFAGEAPLSGRWRQSSMVGKI